MIEKAPLFFKPYLKTVIWGGNKICNYKGIPQPEPNIGESWEISEIPGHESVVATGKYAGLTLTELIRKFGAELLGKKVYEKYNGKFPLLIKLIDANDNLSVQVHPDDNLAKKRHNCLGKTEMWYIISADENAKIYAGLRIKTDPEDYVHRINNGTFAETLATHDSFADDVFFLPAGRVHAIGAGNLLAEIQESSDITYRIYDYERIDANGNKRELHTEQARDAIDYTVYPSYKNPAPDDTDEVSNLVNCEHFKTYRIKVEKEKAISLPTDSFTVLMCLAGNINLKYPSGEIEIGRGQTVLLPASLEDIILNGRGKILMARSL